MKPSGQEIVKLLNCGLLVPDFDGANRFLETHHFEHIMKYVYFFFQEEQKLVRKNVGFDDVIFLYQTDQAIRVAVFRLLCELELYLRAQVVSAFRKRTQDRAPYNDGIYFTSKSLIEEWKQKVKQAIGSDSDLNESLAELVENISFSKLVELYSIMNSSEFEGNILSLEQHVDLKVLTSWFNAFVALRNMCVHGHPLWNLRSKVIVPECSALCSLREKPCKVSSLFKVLTVMVYSIRCFAWEVANLNEAIEQIRVNLIVFYRRFPWSSAKLGIVKNQYLSLPVWTGKDFRM